MNNLMTSNSQKGYIIPILIAVIVIVTAGIIYFVIYNPNTNSISTTQTNTTATKTQPFSPLNPNNTKVVTNNDQANNNYQNIPIYSNTDNSTDNSSNDINQNISIVNNTNNTVSDYLNNLATQQAIRNSISNTNNSNSFITNTNSLVTSQNNQFLSNNIGQSVSNTDNFNSNVDTSNATTNSFSNDLSVSNGSNGLSNLNNPIGSANNIINNTVSNQSSNNSSGSNSGSGSSGSSGSNGLVNGIIGAGVTAVGSALINKGLSSLADSSSNVADSATGGNFGGRVTDIMYCTCSGSLLLGIDDVRGSYIQLVYMFGLSKLYENYNIYSIGQNVLGTYTYGGVCLIFVGVGCTTYGIPRGIISMIGTS